MTHISRGSRLRALNRLLDYALAESQDLGVTQLDVLLGAASLAVSEELHSAKAPLPQMAASRARVASRS